MGIHCCRDCMKRSPGCHDHCDTYLHAKAEFEEEKKIRKNARDAELVYTSFRIEAAARNVRRKLAER